MLARTPIIAAAILLAAGYAGSPCLALYRLNHAMNSGDVATLSQLVDWASVREGLQEDIADQVSDVADPKAVAAGAQLAPFGFSFMRTIASRAVSEQVTPQNVVTMLRRRESSRHGLGLRLAYFDGWSRFMVRLGSSAESRDVRLQLDLEDGNWRVTRVWLPLQMLRHNNSALTLQHAKAEVSG